jgi:alpha-beta hydrolase superfamily lysophospholipase
MTERWQEFKYLDRAEILSFVFYPRQDFEDVSRVPNAESCYIPVDDSVTISCRFYMGDSGYSNVLYFHGNGEIASDYDEIGAIFNGIGINLFVADYRGYGRSSGSPTLSSMIKDAHPIYQGFKVVLNEQGYSGKLFIMGRSLGSASAIELAYSYQDELSGMIIESGIANMFKLMSSVGFPISLLGIDDTKAPTSMELIRKIKIPTLIIHGEFDQIVPVEEGKANFENVAAKDKRLVIIPGVEHNTIFAMGANRYLEALKEFVKT